MDQGNDVDWRSPGESPQSANPQSEPSPLEPFFRHLAELRAYVGLYLETRADQVRIVVRKAILLLLVGLIALTAGAAAVVTLIVLLLQGLARGVAALLGDRLWAGDLIIGGGALVLLAIAGYVCLRWISKQAERRLAKKYQDRREVLQRRFSEESSRNGRGVTHV